MVRPLLLAVLVLFGACSSATSPLLPVACGAVPALGISGDTVRVVVHVDSLPPSSTGEVLVRVDPLGEGSVSFASPPPPTAVAVSATFTLAGVYQGCFSEAPEALFLRTPAAPRGKAWLRISTDRAVRVRVETGEPGPTATPRSDWMVVLPGSSARGPWTVGVGG